MKKSIADLLDRLDYTPRRTKAENVVSIEKVKELTMEKIGRPHMRAVQRRPRRVFALVSAAAVSIALLCGAVYATNAFGIRDHFRELFAGPGTEMSTNDIDSLENIGAAEAQSVTSNGTAMTVTAAVYDWSSYYLALDITAPEGTILNNGDSFWQIFGDTPEEWCTITLPDGGEFSHSMSTMFSDDTPGDNKLTLVIEIVEGEDGNIFGNGESKTLRIPGLWLQSPDKVYTKILDGVWEFDLERIGVSGKNPGAPDPAPPPNVPPADGSEPQPTPMW
jgi:hypothetical protein